MIALFWQWNMENVEFVIKDLEKRITYIYITAETPGKVFIEGSSSLRFSGEWLYISGLIFKNGHTQRNAVIEFRTSSRNMLTIQFYQNVS